MIPPPSRGPGMIRIFIFYRKNRFKRELIVKGFRINAPHFGKTKLVHTAKLFQTLLNFFLHFSEHSFPNLN